MSDGPRIALLFDFDGTVYLGDLAVHAFARRASQQLRPASGRALMAAVRALLEDSDDIPGDPHLDLSAAETGRQAVEIAGSALGLDRAALTSAYQASRRDLAGSAFAVEPVTGLPELLEDLSDDAVRVLTCNAEPAGIDEVLACTGLAGHFDRVISRAGKPQSLPTIASDVIAEIDGDAGAVLGAGDSWSRDLAPIAAMGASTACVDRFGRGLGDPTFRGPDLGSMIEDIRSWAHDRLVLSA